MRKQVGRLINAIFDSNSCDKIEFYVEGEYVDEIEISCSGVHPQENQEEREAAMDYATCSDLVEVVCFSGADQVGWFLLILINKGEEIADYQLNDFCEGIFKEVIA